ncbi:MAG: hypothetical protein JJT76_12745 [Clostridiaceae bacterium]|nr:hypothetical protein [Clostridiaceae bacterium]
MKDKKEFLKGLILIALGLILGISSNANPVPLIERVLIPLAIGRGALHYAGLIVIIVYYIGFKKIFTAFGKDFVSGKAKILLLVIVMFAMSAIGGVYHFVEQTYMSFQDDIGAVYVDRDNSTMRFRELEEGIVEVNAMLLMENNSNEAVKTHIKIIIPAFIKESIVEEEVVIKDENGEIKTFSIPSRSEERLFIDFHVQPEEPGEFGGAEVKGFEFILFDEEGEIVFKNPKLAY